MDNVVLDNKDNILSIGNDSNNSNITLVKKTKKTNDFHNFIPRKEQNEQVLRPPNMQTFEAFSNPQKQTLSDSDSDGNHNVSEVTEEPSDMMSDMGYEEEGDDIEEIDSPSAGYKSIDEEKQDLLYKLHRVAQKGYPVSKKFSMFSDIKELRAEVHKIRKDSQVDASLKMSKKALIAIVSGLEFINNRYDPFSLELDGWSENVMLNVGDGDYDNVLERLCEKYAGRVNSPPELELLMTLAGSAMMFHISNSMFKKDNFKNTFANMSESNNDQENQEIPSAPPLNELNDDKYSNVKEMKGPSFDINNMMGGLGRFPPMPMMSEPRKQSPIISEDTASEKSEIFSDSASEMEVKSVSLTNDTQGQAKRRQRKKKFNNDQTISI